MDCEVTAPDDARNSNESCSMRPDVKQQRQGEILSLGEHNTSKTVLMNDKNNDNSGLTTPEDKQHLNRRSTLRPRKCISKDIGSNLRKTMKKTFRNNKFLYNQQLETIFEEPLLTKQGDLVFIGLSKAKRSITFSQFVTKTKMKKRKMKAKKLREEMLAERKKMEDVETKLWNLGL